MRGRVRSLVPVAGDVVEVELDDGPEGASDIGGVSVGNQPVGVVDNGSGTEGGAI